MPTPKTAAAAGPESTGQAPPDTPAADQSPPTSTAPESPAAVEPSAGPDVPDPGGVFVNVAAHALQIPFPGVTVQPGRVVDLPYTPSHRDLKPATPADVEASRAAEQAEAEAALAAASGQEQ